MAEKKPKKNVSKKVTKKVTKKSATKPKPKTSKKTAPQPRVIKINKTPILTKPEEPVAIQKPITFAHKTNTIDGMIGTNEFRQDVATPRLKIQPLANPKKLEEEKLEQENVIEPKTMITPDHQIAESSAPQEEISLEDTAVIDDPFLEILNKVEENESSNNLALEPHEVSRTESKNLVDEIESPKPFDSKHYHAPIRPRALKSGGTYFLEFLVILFLIALFAAILIDAGIYNPGFELPFDVI